VQLVSPVCVQLIFVVSVFINNPKKGLPPLLVIPATKSPGAILNMRFVHGPKGERQDAWSNAGIQSLKTWIPAKNTPG
jgi:hypothetical protein